MENVVLTIHLIIAVILIGIVLLQRSEGGALGMGGGGGGNGLVSSRGAATALSKVTWGLAAAFICTSIALTVIAARDAGRSSVLDGISGGSAPSSAPASDGLTVLPPAADTPAAPEGTTPAPGGNAPLAPPPAE